MAMKSGPPNCVFRRMRPSGDAGRSSRYRKVMEKELVRGGYERKVALPSKYGIATVTARMG
jgi:hypothetical protein